jgi:hypothetical protein
LKRIGRHILNALTLLSLLLCVATAGLWLRSQRTADTIFLVYKTGGSDQLRCMRGRLMLHRSYAQMPRVLDHVSFRAERVTGLPPPLWPDVQRERRWLFFQVAEKPRPSPKLFQAVQAAEDALAAWQAMGPLEREQSVQPILDSMARASAGVSTARGKWARMLVDDRNIQLQTGLISARAALLRTAPGTGKQSHPCGSCWH